MGFNPLDQKGIPIEDQFRNLYRAVAARANSPVLQSKYKEFGEETVRHVEILESLITQMGGNVNYVSPTARASRREHEGARVDVHEHLGWATDTKQRLVKMQATSELVTTIGVEVEALVARVRGVFDA